MTEDSLSSEQANRIADAIEDIERNVSRLRAHQEMSREEYCDVNNIEVREAVERKFEKLTAAVLDVAETVLKAERGTVPDRRKETIAALKREGLIDASLSRRLRDAVGFRDVLAHAYGPIVSDDIVYDALQNSLDRYVEFVEAIHEYLETVG